MPVQKQGGCQSVGSAERFLQRTEPTCRLQMLFYPVYVVQSVLNIPRHWFACLISSPFSPDIFYQYNTFSVNPQLARLMGAEWDAAGGDRYGAAGKAVSGKWRLRNLLLPFSASYGTFSKMRFLFCTRRS